MVPISLFPVTYHSLSSKITAWKGVIQKNPDLKRRKPKTVAKLWISGTPQFFKSVALDLASVHKRDREYFGSVGAK